MTPWGVASFEPRGLIGRIYVADHYTLIHTQYISCGPHGFREEDKFYKSMGANDARVWPVWTPGAWLAGFM